MQINFFSHGAFSDGEGCKVKPLCRVKALVESKFFYTKKKKDNFVSDTYVMFIELTDVYESKAVFIWKCLLIESVSLFCGK